MVLSSAERREGTNAPTVLSRASGHPIVRVEYFCIIYRGHMYACVCCISLFVQRIDSVRTVRRQIDSENDDFRDCGCLDSAGVIQAPG